MKLPESVKSILDALHSGGYEAYAVGGCVRDALLGKEPQDWDVTTSAEPEEIKAIFPVTIDTGIEHGTVTVRMNGESFEVTTFRTEGKYTDHRRPEEVHFTKSLKEDLLRRDFTINAMAFGGEDAAGENDGRAGLIDLYGGQQDLADGVIRCVGNPFERFSEDALRILRAFRFAAQLSAPEGGVIDVESFTAQTVSGKVRRQPVAPAPGPIAAPVPVATIHVLLKNVQSFEEEKVIEDALRKLSGDSAKIAGDYNQNETTLNIQIEFFKDAKTSREIAAFLNRPDIDSLAPEFGKLKDSRTIAINVTGLSSDTVSGELSHRVWW